MLYELDAEEGLLIYLFGFWLMDSRFLSLPAAAATMHCLLSLPAAAATMQRKYLVPRTT